VRQGRVAVIEEEWMARGLCRTRKLPRDTFYPDSSVGVARARRICARCPVKEQCLEYALENHQSDGIWGGTSERQRAKLQRRRRALKDRQSPNLRSPPVDYVRKTKQEMPRSE